MKQDTAAAVPDVWNRYASVEDARAAAKRMYHDATGFIDWIDR
jgi:hypothetical protein